MGSLAKRKIVRLSVRLSIEAKQRIEELFKNSLEGIEEQTDLRSLGEKIDPTLPAVPDFSGGIHPLTSVRRRIVSILEKSASPWRKPLKLKPSGIASMP